MVRSAILNNALDSIERGLEYFATSEPDPPHKHAIRSLFHGVELLLKERLRREHEILIYRHLDRDITPGSLTVGVNEAIKRLANLGVRLPDYQVRTITRLQEERNRIEHHFYERRDDEHVPLVLRSICLVQSFLFEHLDCVLKDSLEDDSHLFELQADLAAIDEQPP